MKYHQQPGTGVSVHVDAAPEAVWAIVSDINLPARYDTELQKAEWIEPATGPAPGATFAGFNKHELIGEWQVVCRVDWCEPGRAFGWRVTGDDGGPAQWVFTMTPEGDGTRLRFDAQMGPGQSGLNPAIERMPDREDAIVANRLAEWSKNMTKVIEGAKALAEAT